MIKIVTGIVVDVPTLGYVIIIRTLAAVGNDLVKIHEVILRMLKQMDCVQKINMDEIVKH